MRFFILILKFIFLISNLVFAGENLDLFQVAKEGNANQIRELIDSGKHSELIEKCEEYKSLYQKQLA